MANAEAAPIANAEAAAPGLRRGTSRAPRAPPRRPRCRAWPGSRRAPARPGRRARTRLRDPAIHKIGPDGEGVARAEDAGPVRLGQQAGTASVHEQAGVPVGQEAHRRRASGSGSGAPGRSRVRRPPRPGSARPEAGGGGLGFIHADAGPGGHVAPGRRSEGPRRRSRGGPDPRRASSRWGRSQASARANRSARRRCHVPEGGRRTRSSQALSRRGSPSRVAQLPRVAGAVAQGLTDLLDRGRHGGRVSGAIDPLEPGSLRLADALGIARELPGGHEVDGRAHERRRMTSRAASARVRSSRRKPARRAQRPT